MANTRKNGFRDKITHAALTLFAQHGVANTSIAAIIKEAGIAHKTFFNHFPNKDQLLQHIVSSHSAMAYCRFQVALTQYDDPQQQLQFCLMAIARSLGELDPQRYRDLLTFYFVSSASTREFRDKQKQDFTALIQQILQAAADHHRLRTHCDVNTLTEIVSGLCVATLLNWCVEDQYPIVTRMKQVVAFINESVFVETAT